jgi:hypothetical protein
LLWVALAAAAGSLVSGTLGWFDNGGPFNARKFTGNVIRSLTAGMSFALLEKLSGFTGAALYFAAFLGGAGVDGILNKAQGGFTRGDPLQKKLDQLEAELIKITREKTG